MKLPLMKDAFLDETQVRKELADFILSGDRLSMGPQCAEFEKVFAAWQKRRYAVLVGSGASANLVLIQSLLNLGKLWGRGAKIGVSGITWATNVMPLVQLGLTPVPIDIAPWTLCIDGTDFVKKAKDLDALFVTDLLGFISEMPEVAGYCKERGILLLEDTCEALGSQERGVKAGNFGLASTFSFYVAHHISTIEGGMVVTDDHELADMLKMVRANGWDRNLGLAQTRVLRKTTAIDEFHAPYAFYVPGMNVRPTEITGFLGLSQMRRLEPSLESRLSQYHEVLRWSQADPNLWPLDFDIPAFATPIICRLAHYRERLISRCGQVGIECRPLVSQNITRQPFWRRFVGPVEDLAGADFLSSRGMYVANYPFMSESERNTLKSLFSTEIFNIKST